MAPSAQLYLICIDSEVGLGNAEQYAVNNGIKIISHSVGWFNSCGGDGTGAAGTPDGIAADAAAHGILWVNAAGNEAMTHWSGTFDDDGYGWNLFAPVNGNGFWLPQGDEACAALKWDDWPLSSQDYGMYLYTQTGVDPVAGWHNVSHPFSPTIGFCYTNNTGIDQAFYVTIFKWNATTTASPRFDLYVLGVGQIQHPVAAGSLIEPASSPSTFAAGAICWQNNSLEPYSSQGPTIDGRTKPDIAGQDSNSSATYGNFTGCGTSGFAGTSASAPATAGAAASSPSSTRRGLRCSSRPA